MGPSSFLKLVEIQTKVASVFPYIIGILYAIWRFERFDLTNFLLMLVSLLCIDMGTTATNNYMDYRKANRRHGYGYEEHNAIVRDGLSERAVVTIIVLLFAIAAVFGLWLVARTDWVVLAIGILSCMIGILYSAGPVPISRTLLGELMSGFTMGFFIVFLGAYIHTGDVGLIAVGLEKGRLIIDLAAFDLLAMGWLSFPMILTIAGIMLANNICDMEDDWENKRFTLPIQIGLEKSIVLFKLLYAGVYGSILAGMVCRVMPLTFTVVLLTLMPVSKLITAFVYKPVKSETFANAVKIHILVSAFMVLSLALAILYKAYM